MIDGKVRVLLLQAYRRLVSAVAGKGLGRFRVLQAARSFAADKLERDLVDARGHKMFVDPVDTLQLKANGTWERKPQWSWPWSKRETLSAISGLTSGTTRSSWPGLSAVVARYSRSNRIPITSPF